MVVGGNFASIYRTFDAFPPNGIPALVELFGCQVLRQHESFPSFNIPKAIHQKILPTLIFTSDLGRGQDFLIVSARISGVRPGKQILI